MSLATPAEALVFWFNELDPARRFAKDRALDAEIGARFGATLHAAIRGELDDWRDTPAAFAQDPQALCLAQALVRLGQDQALAPERRAFAYLPFMHSESALIHEQAVKLFSQPGLEDNLLFERRHQAIVQRFGRYPHRNAILGRVSTPEEITFLAEPGSSF